MALDYDKILKSFSKALKNLTPEDMEKYFPKDTTPKGWVSVEDKLPMWMAKDVGKGYSEYKVKDKDGKEFKTAVTDHMSWYYFVAKERGITHWWKE